VKCVESVNVCVIFGFETFDVWVKLGKIWSVLVVVRDICILCTYQSTLQPHYIF